MATREPTPRRHFIVGGLWAVLAVGWAIDAAVSGALFAIAAAVLWTLGTINSLWWGCRNLARQRELDTVKSSPTV